MRRHVSHAAGTIIALCLLAVSSARAEITLAPGAWQQIEIGTEDGKPAVPVTYHDCLTSEQARDPIKALAGLNDLGRLIARQCQGARFQQSADKIVLSFTCGDEKTISIALDLAFTFLDKRHYNGTIKSTFMVKGATTVSDKTIEAKWLGPQCRNDRSAPDQP